MFAGKPVARWNGKALIGSRDMGATSRIAAIVVGAIAFAGQPVRAESQTPTTTSTIRTNTSLPELSRIEWRQVAKAADDVVARESPTERLPFDTAASGVGRRMVFADYIPSLPLSIDNAPFNGDYYSRHLPTGAEPESIAVKRFVVWERPLPAGVWPPRLFLATNAAVEIKRAERIGIDGFLATLFQVNSGRYWNWTRVQLDAAAATAPRFRIVPEPDMNALKAASLGDIADALTYFYRHPAAYKLADGRLLVLPFKVENRPLAFWQALQAEMKRRSAPIALVAASLATEAGLPYAPASVALGFWGGRDPPAAATQLAAAQRMTASTGLPVILPIAPQDTRPKTSIFWEARNTEAFRAQWDAAIRLDAPWVRLVTWNDYTEGTEVAPSSTTQFLFYDLAAYYIAWYKTGAAPQIRRDALFYAFRRQIFDPTRSDIGTPYRRLGTTPVANDVELIGFLRQPGTLEIKQSGGVSRAAVGAGLQMLRAPAVVGAPCFRLEQDGHYIVTLPVPVGIEARPLFRDGLYGGGSSLRPYRSFDAVASAVPGGRPAMTIPAREPAAGACAD